jgi:ABC-type bacteriocin/lantibiotic exporter with double-glycine peptidase domain
MSLTSPNAFRPRDFFRFLIGSAMFAMLAMILVQEFCSATTTWLVIRIARDIAEETVSAGNFGWIVVAQTVSYLAGAVSWIFAERAGFGAYSRYMLHFARQNRFQTALLGDTAAREQTEPFLTSETFHVCFELIFTLQFHLRLFFQLLFNSLVLGAEIDAGLPLAFAAAFVVLAALQWFLREPLAAAYLHNQRMTNRMTARTYNAWDNIFSGNRYNFAFWHRDFRQRLSDALAAQIRAILLREGWSAFSGLIALVLVLSTTAWIAVQDAGHTALLIALAATLPRQIEMTLDMHQLTVGLTDLLAVWTRIKGVCEHLCPLPAAGFAERIGFGRVVLKEGAHERSCLSLADAVRHALAAATGLITVRGGNGSGKSTLLAALKAQLHGQAYYWPTQDRLAFAFNTGGGSAAIAEEESDDPDEIRAMEDTAEKRGYSSGERQLQVLREIVSNTAYPVYLLDEWDANLDVANRAVAVALVDELARRARVIEVSHRDRS